MRLIVTSFVLFGAAVFVIAVLSDVAAVSAQPPAAAPAAPMLETVPAANPVNATVEEKAFLETAAKWKDLMKQLSSLQVEHHSAADADKPAVIAKFEKARVEAETLIPQLKSSAEKAFESNPKNNEAVEFLMSTIEESADEEQYGEALRVINLLQKNKIDRRELKLMATHMLWHENKFAEAKAMAQAADAQQSDTISQSVVKTMNKYDDMWKKESRSWRPEAEGNQDPKTQLPRVKISTTKGDIVVELLRKRSTKYRGQLYQPCRIEVLTMGLISIAYFSNFTAQGGDPNTKNANRLTMDQVAPVIKSIVDVRHQMPVSISAAR